MTECDEQSIPDSYNLRISPTLSRSTSLLRNPATHSERSVRTPLLMCGFSSWHEGLQSKGQVRRLLTQVVEGAAHEISNVTSPLNRNRNLADVDTVPAHP